MRPNSPIRTAILGFLVLCAMAGTAFARSAEPIFTIAKYPVEATGTNAVAAKRDAVAQGRRSAFRSLLKRLVPAAAYSQIEHLKKLDPEPYIGSVRVRAEENSSTQYIATLDFSFEPEAVRTLLGQHGVTYVDRPAPATRLLLLYGAPKTGAPKAMSGPKGWGSWRRVWADLDLANSLTPLELERKPADLAPAAVKALLAAEPAAIASLGDQFKSSQVIVAEARPDPASNELHVTLAGQDAVGRFAVTTRYRLDDDFVYSLELAAVIAQGVLEGRWKARMASGQISTAGGATGGALTSLQVLAEFNNLGQWQRQQQVLSSTPGVRNLQIGSLSGRSARIALSYHGGGTALQAALRTKGLTLENINGFWILR